MYNLLMSQNATGLFIMLIMGYLILHSPAIIMLIIGLVKRKSKPELAKILFIMAGVYFVVGLGVCGAMFIS